LTPPLALPLIRSHPELLQAAISANAPRAERGRLREPRERIVATTSFLDATAYGVRGMIDDYRCYSGGSGFEAASVSPAVHVWHGARDALALATSLPRCRMFLHPDEGHHFFRPRLGEIMAALLGHDRRPSWAAP